MISLNPCLTSLVEFIASGEDQPMSLAKATSTCLFPLFKLTALRALADFLT